MIVHPTDLPGVLVLEPRVFQDQRGYFLETFNAERFAEHAALGLPRALRQTNHSRSRRGVVRGLHFQLRHPQGKLISLAHGRIFDVVVDVRPDSPTFRRWLSFTLDAGAPRQLWIPPGYAHGFCVLSEVADVTYACTEVYVPDDDLGVRWDDPELAVDWPLRDPLVSPRDAALPTLAEARDRLPRWSA